MHTPSLSSRPTRAGSFLDVRSPSATTRPHASPTYDHDCRVKSLRLDAFATPGSTVALPLQPRETFCAVRRSWRASSWRRGTRFALPPLVAFRSALLHLLAD